jgi:putative DNA primase/helicase
MEFAKATRKSDRFEPKITMIASLASVLIEPLNALPFIVNIWGDTGRGKTLSSMFATSVWANPEEGVYMSDAKSTATALELRQDVLNHLPMFIDDMSQVKRKYDGDFSELVYMLCSGKGKDRANTSLGLNKSTTWKNTIITNYEYSLVTETMQGGAVNRIIDVECADGYIFENGNEVAELLRNNYGFAGRKFIEIIKQLGIPEIRKMQKQAYKAIISKAKAKGVEKEEKQILPMSIIWTADLIATKYIFEDGEYLDYDYCVDLLKNKNEVSENERAYEFIQSEVTINISKFKPSDPIHDTYKGEVWGRIEDEYTIIISNVFEQMCKRGNFSSRSFLSWAKKRNLLDHEEKRNTKRKSIQGTNTHCVCIKLPTNQEILAEETNDDGFISLDNVDQEKLPFL